LKIFILSNRKSSENANPWSQLRTARLELYMYSIISFMFSDEYLYKFLLVNHSNGDKFLGLMEQHKDNQLFYWFKMIKIKM